MGHDLSREAMRQQQLLRTLWGRDGDPAVAPWLAGPPAAAGRGLAAYRLNARALAERALSAAFPTVRELVGPDSFRALASAFWLACPPARGDLAWFGDELPAFIEGDAQLAGEPYLADVARLDWALHRVELSADATQPPNGLHLLGESDPAGLHLRLCPGAVLLRSGWPVGRIRQAHRASGEGRFADVRQALDRGEGEDVFVWRRAWQGLWRAVPADDAAFLQALLDGAPLGLVLEGMPAAFSFESWLIQALQEGWIAGVHESRC